MENTVQLLCRYFLLNKSGKIEYFKIFINFFKITSKLILLFLGDLPTKELEIKLNISAILVENFRNAVWVVVVNFSSRLTNFGGSTSSTPFYSKTKPRTEKPHCTFFDWLFHAESSLAGLHVPLGAPCTIQPGVHKSQSGGGWIDMAVGFSPLFHGYINVPHCAGSLYGCSLWPFAPRDRFSSRGNETANRIRSVLSSRPNTRPLSFPRHRGLPRVSPTIYHLEVLRYVGV